VEINPDTMSKTATIYHNPRCAKSRQTLNLLIDYDVDPIIVEYLKTPLSEEELRGILRKLNIKAGDLVRKGEVVYKEKYKGKELSEEEWIRAMIEHPKLMERPIVVDGDKARLGRPPENVIELFKS
jgi:arsenate reductase